LNYSLLSELLKRINISTCYARNGLEAVNMIKDQPDISLVLMDIKLPIMNGNEATMQIKKIRPGIPVIAHSAYAGKAEIQQSFQAGCDDYITKPVDTKLFLEKISWYCSMASR
jgi:CheY-like chemotaxis protein